MSAFTLEELELAVAQASVADIPLTPDALDVAARVTIPALESLPSHLCCEAVSQALLTMFVMGIGVGVELKS